LSPTLKSPSSEISARKVSVSNVPSRVGVRSPAAQAFDRLSGGPPGPRTAATEAGMKGFCREIGIAPAPVAAPFSTVFDSST
jgi:hypothetical protein